MQKKFVSLIPNFLTLFRIGALPIIILGFYLKNPLGDKLIALFFIVASITDFFDGYCARRWGATSAMGRFLDPIADKILVASILLLLSGFQKISGIHLIPALIILCREILVSGLREFLAETHIHLPVTLLTKWKTALQMTGLSFLLISFFWDINGILYYLGHGGLWIGAGLTLMTGYTYLRTGLKYIIDKA